MALNSISTLKKNRVYAPIITGLAILIIVIFARSGFAHYNEAKNILQTTQTEFSQIEEKLKKLENHSSLLADENSEVSKKVKKIAKDFNTSEILEAIIIRPPMMNNSGLSAGTSAINISNVSIDKGNKEPNGLYRGTVNMSISAPNTYMIADYLDYLTQNSDFAFSLNTISLPINTSGNVNAWENSVNVTLGLYYYP